MSKPSGETSSTSRADSSTSQDDDWLQSLVERDQDKDEMPKPETSRTSDQSTKSAANGSQKKPQTTAAVKTTEDTETGWSVETYRTSLVILIALIALETLAISFYLVFRSVPSQEAVFELPKTHVLPAPAKSANKTGSAKQSANEAAEKQVVVSPKGDGQYSSIGQALKRSPAGSLISVKPGTYRESIVLDKPVEIVGDGPREEIIIETASGATVMMKTDQATLRGLTIARDEAVDKEHPYAVEIPQGELLIEDCDITSKAGNCVFVTGGAANPTLRRCRIHDGVGGGLFFTEGAPGNVEDCDIIGMTNGGIVIRAGANPTIVDCRWKDGKGNAIVIHAASGTFENCTISDQTAEKYFSISIEENANPVFRNCDVIGGKTNALTCASNSRGRFENCQFTKHNQGVVLRSSHTTFVDCTVADNQSAGIWVSEKSTGDFQNCEVRGNNVDVFVSDESAPRFRGCNIHDGKSNGIAMSTKAKGLFEDCEIYNMAGNGVFIRKESNPVFRNCKIHDNNSDGLEALEQARGLFDNCQFTNHPKASAIWLNSGSRVMFRSCRLQSGASGIVIQAGASGMFDDCKVNSFAKSGCITSDDGFASFFNCTLSDCKVAGVEASSASYQLKKCEIARCEIGFFAGGTSSPTVIDTKIHTSNQQGMLTNGSATAHLIDCEIFDNTGINVAAKEKAAPQFLDCKIYNAGFAGLLVSDSARPSLDGCDVYDCKKYGVYLGSTNSTTIRGGTITGCKEYGVYAFGECTPSVEGCAISKNTTANVMVRDKAKLTLRKCTVSEGEGYGLWLQATGYCFADNCTVTETTKSAVQLEDGATAKLEYSFFTKSKAMGIYLTKQSSANMFQCGVLNNGETGLQVVDKSSLSAVGCQFNNNTKSGLSVLEEASAQMTGGSASGNKSAGLVAKSNTSFKVTNVQIVNNQYGLYVYSDGTASVTNCTAKDNAKGDWVPARGAKLTGSENTPKLPTASRSSR